MLGVCSDARSPSRWDSTSSRPAPKGLQWDVKVPCLLISFLNSCTCKTSGWGLRKKDPTWVLDTKICLEGPNNYFHEPFGVKLYVSRLQDYFTVSTGDESSPNVSLVYIEFTILDHIWFMVLSIVLTAISLISFTVRRPVTP